MSAKDGTGGLRGVEAKPHTAQVLFQMQLIPRLQPSARLTKHHSLVCPAQGSYCTGPDLEEAAR